MTTTPQSSPSSGKGKAFFERAEQVADTGNWDFAIELYLGGIAREPENVDRGHKPLRELALKRKAEGGKGPGLGEQFKHGRSKDNIEALTNAEFLLSKDPGSEKFLVQFVKACAALGIEELITWAGELLLDFERSANKKSKSVLLLLTDVFEGIRFYERAIQACQMAFDANPNDNPTREKLVRLQGEYAIQKGRYEEEGDFTKGVADMDKQKDLAQRGSAVKSQSYLEKEIERTRSEYLQSPEAAGKINAHVDALLKFEDEAHESQAVDVLNKAFRDTSSYAFKMRIGDIRIRQMTRLYRQARDAKDAARAEELARRQLQFELDEFSERAVNYPTDLAVKFELGRRQFLAGRLDDAIGSLQQARRDPRRQVRALMMLGQAFAKKEWYREAADSFRAALSAEISEDRVKEVRYCLGDVLEKTGDLAGAAEQFSEVAQLDYNYRDVRDRLDKLRKQSGT